MKYIEMTIEDALRYCKGNKKETVLVAMSHQFGAGFGVGIRIVAIQLLIFPIAPRPFLVQIDLIGCNIQKRLHGIGTSNALQNIDCTHHICLVIEIDLVH